MTGKELIIYILTNNLENEMIFKDGKFLDFMTKEEAAAKFEVGVATVEAWCALGLVKGFTIGDSIFFPRNIDNPLKIVNHNHYVVERGGK